jgi:ABC-type microcin C transport system permease subunit YejB
MKIGKITVNALEKLDYPIITSAILLNVFIFICINILADVIYVLGRSEDKNRNITLQILPNQNQ